MTSRNRDGLAYESLGMELGEVDHSRHNEWRSPQASKAPSQKSCLTGRSSIDDDQQSLVSHQDLSQSGRPTEKVYGDRETPPYRLREKKYRFKSWKIGVLASAATSTIVLLVNSALTLWISIKFGVQGGIGTVTAYEGSCDVAGNWSFVLHILINGLSSILLSASNYSMQCATAPTRTECDRAHARGDWLDIGVPSVRNLFKIAWQRRIMWALLASTSLPIHLLYNSAVYKTLDDNEYKVVLAGRDFPDHDYVVPSTKMIAKDSGKFSPGFTYNSTLRMHETYVFDPSSFRNLSPTSCIETYATNFLSGYGNLVLVADYDSVKLVAWVTESPPNWICRSAENPQTCKTLGNARSLSKQAEWTVDGIKIDHCLAEIEEEHCKLQFSVHILAAVLICNAIKCAAMAWLVWYQRETTFVTFGDAIASWLDEPDPTTVQRCFEGVRDVRHSRSQRTPKPQAIGFGTRRWRLAVSRRRWRTTISLLVIAVLAVGVCLARTVMLMRHDTSESIASLGFGSAHPSMLFRTISREHTSGLILSILFANMPQVVLSCVYMSLNALLTSMHLAEEYSGYEVSRKALRVTTPRGLQRATYWLQLPFKYSIPLIATSATLHWLISQALFLVRIDPPVGPEGRDDSWSSVGLSPAPMVGIICMGGCIALLAILLSHQKLKGHTMPVAASCSLALAAAAHRPTGDDNAAVLLVKWGEPLHMCNMDIGHCCFTSQEVLGVKPGRKYAGTVDKSKID